MSRRSHARCAALVLLAAFAAAAAAAPPAEIQITDRSIGEGPSPQRGWFVVIRYTGWIYDEQAPEGKGRQFVRSDDRGAPVSFVYGYKRALPGIEKGLEGMKPGGRRTLVLPPKYAFRNARQESPDGVPPDATLVLDIELVDVVPQANARPANE